MALDEIQRRQSQVRWLFNLVASLVVVGVGVFLILTTHWGWFGARGSRMSLIAWLVILYGVVRFLLYLWRHREPER